MLGWHKSVPGTLGSPELLGVTPGVAEAVPGVALVSICSDVWGVAGPPAPWVDDTGGGVVGDVASTWGVGLEGGAGTVLVVDSSA